jgi:hypothetical protein
VSHAKDANKFTTTSVYQTTKWWMREKMQYRPAMNTIILYKLVEPLGASIKCLMCCAGDWNLNNS